LTEPVHDATVSALRSVLDRAAKRSAIAASNLANIDTPGYRSLDVRFQEAVEMAGSLDVERTDPRHLPSTGVSEDPGTVLEVPANRIRNDGNTVDVDREMTLLASLQGRYQGAAEMVRKRFALLIYAATDGRNGS
jgi:flagellar basal-body rod protein FlgB